MKEINKALRSIDYMEKRYGTISEQERFEIFEENICKECFR